MAAISGVSFKNVCSYLKFRIPEYIPDVKTVTVSSGSIIAGEMDIDYTGDVPVCTMTEDGSTSLQVLESVQINMSDDHARNALASATHFNPVDIVCCLHDYKGQSFDLLRPAHQN